MKTVTYRVRLGRTVQVDQNGLIDVVVEIPDDGDPNDGQHVRKAQSEALLQAGANDNSALWDNEDDGTMVGELELGKVFVVGVKENA